MKVVHKLQEIFGMEDQQFTAALYRQILNRDPDIKGLNNHVKALKKGVKRETILNSIIKSKEAISKYNKPMREVLQGSIDKQHTILSSLQGILKKDGKEFVEEVYMEILNRKPSNKEYTAILFKKIRLQNTKINFLIRVTASREFINLVHQNKKRNNQNSNSKTGKLTVERVLNEIKKVL